MENTNKMVVMMTAEQLERARQTCREFGPGFNGIVDRIDAVEWARREVAIAAGRYDVDVQGAIDDLLTSVNPVIAAKWMVA